jgi:pimeloyl-ACP methyl ester carboxylesterase
MASRSRSRSYVPAPDTRIRALRTGFRVVGAVAPELAARWAESIFCRPPRQEERPAEEAFLRTGRPATFTHGRLVLRGWEWGDGPLVLLAHGWGSRAGRWAAFVPELVAAGHRVIAYDAPAHGRSDGRLASLPEFARALRAVADVAGPVHGLIGHSLGGAGAALAMIEGLAAERAVLIAAPADPATFSRAFAAYLRIPGPVRDAMQRNLEHRLHVTWDELHLPTIVRDLATPALVVHDRGDDDVPSAEAVAIAEAWPGAELLLTDGLGHRAVLRDPAVIARAVEFLAPGSAAAAR